MALQPDVWMTFEQWKADNQRWNHRPRWQLDQFSERSQGAGKSPDRALVWLGRHLTMLGIWLQNRYGDTCLVEVEVNPRIQASRG